MCEVFRMKYAGKRRKYVYFLILNRFMDGNLILTTLIILGNAMFNWATPNSPNRNMHS